MQLRRTLPPVLLGLAILAASGPWGSTGVTGPVARSWLEGFGLSTTVADLLHEIVRKIGHFLAYGCFAWLTLRALVDSGRPTMRLATIAWGAAVLLACLDETLQALTPDRTGTSRDIALDAVGAAVFLAHALLRAREPVLVPSTESAEFVASNPAPSRELHETHLIP